MELQLRESLRQAVEVSARVVLEHAQPRTFLVMRGTGYGPEERVDLEFGYPYVRGALLGELDRFEVEFRKRHPHLPDAELGAPLVGWPPLPGARRHGLTALDDSRRSPVEIRLRRWVPG